MSTLTDKSGNTLDREAGERTAVDYIIHSGSKMEMEPMIATYITMLSDDELMEWLVDPITGDFVD